MAAKAEHVGEETACNHELLLSRDEQEGKKESSRGSVGSSSTNDATTAGVEQLRVVFRDNEDDESRDESLSLSTPTKLPPPERNSPCPPAEKIKEWRSGEGDDKKSSWPRSALRDIVWSPSLIKSSVCDHPARSVKFVGYDALSWPVHRSSLASTSTTAASSPSATYLSSSQLGMSLNVAVIDELLGRLHNTQDKLTQAMVDLSGEKALRKRRDKNLVKLAKQLHKRSNEAKFKDRQIMEMVDMLQDKENTLKSLTEAVQKNGGEIRELREHLASRTMQNKSEMHELQKKLTKANSGIERLHTKLEYAEQTTLQVATLQVKLADTDKEFTEEIQSLRASLLRVQHEIASTKSVVAEEADADVTGLKNNDVYDQDGEDENFAVGDEPRRQQQRTATVITSPSNLLSEDELPLERLPSWSKPMDWPRPSPPLSTTSGHDDNNSATITAAESDSGRTTSAPAPAIISTRFGRNVVPMERLPSWSKPMAWPKSSPPPSSSSVTGNLDDSDNIDVGVEDGRREQTTTSMVAPLLGQREVPMERRPSWSKPMIWPKLSPMSSSAERRRRRQRR